MGLFDQLAGQALNALGGQKSELEAQPELLTGVMGLIERAGGLPALLGKLQGSGLGDQVASWIGHGENQAVSGEQITQALGEDAVAQVARGTGVAPEQASFGLAQLLPRVIDMLTPNGQVPENDLLQQGLNLLKGKLTG